MSQTTTRFTGIIPPLVTPLHATGELDLESLDRLVDHLLACEIDGLFAMGSSGQVAYLTDAERDVVVSRVVERVGGRVPVVVGTPEMSGRRAAEAARRTEALGVDGVVVAAPVYSLVDATEIGDMFRQVAAAVTVPVIAYDVPVRVGGTKLGHQLLVELALEGALAAVKDSSGNDVAFRQLVAGNEAAGRPMDVLSGHEVMLDGVFLLGADGAVPGLANVDPAGYVRLWRAAQAGDWQAARREQDRLARLFDIAFSMTGYSGDSGGIGAFKQAMASLGVIESGTMPAPLRALTSETCVRIDAILEEVGLR